MDIGTSTGIVIQDIVVCGAWRKLSSGDRLIYTLEPNQRDMVLLSLFFHRTYALLSTRTICNVAAMSKHRVSKSSSPSLSKRPPPTKWVSIEDCSVTPGVAACQPCSSFSVNLVTTGVFRTLGKKMRWFVFRSGEVDSDKFPH